MFSPDNSDVSISTAIKLDRLTVCFTDSNKENVKKTVGLLIDDHVTKFTPSMTVTKNHRYLASCRIGLPLSAATCFATFEAGPLKPGMPSYRLDVNPSKLSAGAWIDLLVFLESCIDADTVEFFRCGKITRVDLALDFPNLHLSDVIVRTTRLRKHGVYSDSHGEPQTIYVGTPRSRRVVAYEKPNPITSVSSLRLECRLKPRIFGCDMAKLVNPFAHIALIPTGFSISVGLPVPPQYIDDAIRIGGLKRAERPLSKEQRNALRKAWLASGSLLPDLDKVWANWPTLLTGYGLGKHLGVLHSHFNPHFAPEIPVLIN